MLSTCLLTMGVVVAGSAGAAPPAAVEARSVPPPPRPAAERGAALVHRPTAQQARRATALAQDPLQQSAQPVQRIAAAPAVPSAREARPVRLTSNGAWTWYSDPRVLKTATHTYFAYVTKAGSVMLTSLSNTDARLTTTTLSRYQLRDDHNVPALVETADGRIAAFWGGHGRAPVRYRVSAPAGNISSMSPTRVLKGSGLESANATYVQAFRMRGVSHQYHVMTRRQSDQNWVITTSKDLVTWTRPVQPFKNSEQDVRTWPYLEAATSGWRQMHFAVTDGHPAQDVNNSLYHFTYDAGTKQLATSTGAPVARPAFPRSGTLIYDGRSLDGRIRVYDLALRPGGRPTIAFTTVDRDPATSGYTYKWATLQGRAWTIRTVARQADYPEGIALDSSDANRAYLVTRAGTQTQLSELSTQDAGGTWLSRPVALQTGEQRTPTTPFGSGGHYSVMWMAGEYRRYTDYDTGIVAESTGPMPIALTTTWPKSWALGGGVSAKIQAGIGGPVVPGTRAWLLVRKPGQPQQFIRSAVTDPSGSVHLSINRFYPKGTQVWVFVPAEGEWGAAKSQGHKK